MTNSTRSTWWILAACAALAGCAGGSGDDGGGECDLLPGDLVITEIMANPVGPDDGQEYFEIYNATSAPVDMAGITLRYAKADGTGEKTHDMEEIVVEAGDYLVVGDVVQELKPNHVDYGYGNALGAMLNGGATLSIACGGEVIDEVAYPSMEEARFDGVSFGVDGNVAPDHLLNDDVENFCPATAEFATDMFGSPGEANQVCNVVTPGMCSSGGTDRAVNTPEAGDLIITEYMPSPAGTDGDQEWFEIHALNEVDLNGLVAGEVPGVPKINVDAAECVTLAAGAYAVFAKKAEVELNGGIEGVIDTFTFALTDMDSLYIGVGDQVLDAVVWTDDSPDEATSLDPGSYDAAANDDEGNWCPAVDPYGPADDQNFGTPGAENPSCPVTCDEGQCNGDSGCRDIVPPGAGDILITEALPDPAGTASGVDGRQEWFEMEAQAAFDLNGLEYGRMDTTTTTRTIEDDDCLAVENGDLILFAHQDTDNGGLPPPDVIFDFSLIQDNGILYVGPLAAPLSTFPYGGVDDGQARQLNPAGDEICDAEDEYGDAGNTGSPREANPESATECTAL